MELFELNRFVEAQESFNTYETALKEVKEGTKRSHWIWYIFPQVDGMGHSSTSKKYGIKSLLEAKAYFENDFLRDHLYEITNALLEQDDSAQNIFGALDAMKVRSCMTLFNIVSPDDVFAEVLTKFYDSNVCRRTLEIVKKELTAYKGNSAFVRNGIRSQEKAFFEDGSHESNQYSHKQKMATMLDLVSRRDSMLSMVQYYFWNKDMSIYRVSGVELTVHMYLENLINEFIVDLKDESLIKDIREFRNAIPYEDCNVFNWAKAYDAFYKKFHKNPDVKAAFDVILKESLCKPMEKKAIAREYNDEERPMFTPGKLSSLKDDEIFVFGSNLAGAHGGGAARAALMRFGAVWGQGVGLQGQSYAIPTMQGGVDTIKPYVDNFIYFARNHTDLFFYVTRIGCGIAGFKDEDIAPLFAEALSLDNVCLPKSFCDILKENAFANTSSMLIAYGQVRTMTDILIELDKTEHFSNSRSAIEAVEEYIRKQEVGHMNISAYAFSILANTLENGCCFVGGHLDDREVKYCFEQEHSKKRISPPNALSSIFGFKPVYEDTMFKYCYAKIWKLICYLNDFRRYSNPQEIQQDLQKLNLRDYFKMGGTGGDYPKYFFRRTIDEAWRIIAPHGHIDEGILKRYMFENHENSVRAIGLEETINRDFEMDHCHSDVFFPKQIGTAPVYVEKKNEYGRRFVKSCGEGKGPNQFHEAFEFRYAERLLWNDPNYDVYGEYDCHFNYTPMYFIPKYDRTLPVYQISYGFGEKVYFKSVNGQKDFYDNALAGLQVASRAIRDQFIQYCRV